MKILMVSNKVITYSLGAQNSIEPLKRLGAEIVWAADFSRFHGDISAIPCITEQISIHTNPLKLCNFKAYRQLLDLIDRYQIDAVVCSTPIGGLLARLAAKQKRIQPVLYAAHGFLFFKGAPLINRTLFKWEEELLAPYTDVLVTITKEDYAAAQSLKLRGATRPYLIHGAGVKVGVHVETDRKEKRRSIGVPVDSFVVISAGELNKNKNTRVIIQALKDAPQVHYVVCGDGPEKEVLVSLSQKLNVSNRVHFLGYRTDMPELYAMADAFVMMSFREGLPRALLEAMDLALPCVGSDTRGIRDLIDADGGFICSPKDAKAFADAFEKMRINPELCARMGAYNKTRVSDYSCSVVREELFEIYRKTFIQ